MNLGRSGAAKSSFLGISVSVKCAMVGRTQGESCISLFVEPANEV